MRGEDFSLIAAQTLTPFHFGLDLKNGTDSSLFDRESHVNFEINRASQHDRQFASKSPCASEQIPSDV